MNTTQKKQTSTEKKVKTKDLVIVSHLRQNARATLTEISRKTGIPVSTIAERLKSSEHSIITKHTSLINFSKAGYPLRASLIIKVSPENKEQLKQYLMNHHCINSAYLLGHSCEFLIECIFEHVNNLDSLIETIEEKFKIQERRVSFITEDLKREGFLSADTIGI